MPTIGPRIGTKFSTKAIDAPQQRIGHAADPHHAAGQQTDDDVDQRYGDQIGGDVALDIQRDLNGLTLLGEASAGSRRSGA